MSLSPPSLPAPAPESCLARLSEARARLSRQVAGVIVGQNAVVEETLIALFAGGHALLEGVPGLAKTLLVKTVAQALDLTFSRIQFTPDLMPQDVTGGVVIESDPHTGERRFRFAPGPVFAHVLLADEINRTPPKTQAALLQAMQDGRVSAAGEDHALEPPFVVLATRNPIEMEGTYPLPRAQRDRFLLQIAVGYPTPEEEAEIARRTTTGPPAEAVPALSRDEVLAMQRLVRAAPLPEKTARYALALTRALRPGGAADVGAGRGRSGGGRSRAAIARGPGTRAAAHLALAAKARAALAGRPFASVGDVRAVAAPALRHRVELTPHALSEGLAPDLVIARAAGALDAHERQGPHGGLLLDVLRP
ncbi:MAG: AAA family ATPase [Planctomycetes bacterium]|nr:AAA family ATPase [Planctomycetota bacterium]